MKFFGHVLTFLVNAGGPTPNAQRLALVKMGVTLLLISKHLTVNNYEPWLERRFHALCQEVQAQAYDEKIGFDLEPCARAYNIIASLFTVRRDLFRYILGMSKTATEFRSFYDVLRQYMEYTDMNHINITILSAFL